MRNVFTIGFLIIAATAPALSGQESTGSLEVLQGRPVATTVFVDGHGPFRFLLDTGAQSNQIDRELARKLGIPPTFRVELASATGSALVPATRGVAVHFGSAAAANQEFLFTDLSAVRRLDPAIDGVLGQEFLAKFDYLLDFRSRTITFSAPPAEGERIPAERREGSLLLPTSEGLMVLDSGTEAAILFRNSGGTRMVMAAASGFSAASGSTDVRIKIGKRTYKSRTAAFASAAHGREAGLLPASLFHSLYISNSGGYVVVP